MSIITKILKQITLSKIAIAILTGFVPVIFISAALLHFFMSNAYMAIAAGFMLWFILQLKTKGE